MAELFAELSMSFQELLGLTPWNVKLGHGSFLTMEFGKEIVKEFCGRSHSHGEWHLWLRSCAWRLERNGRTFIASGDERDVVARVINRTEFGSLMKAEIDSSSLDLSLTFSGQINLVTFGSNRYRYEQWELFRPDGQVLVANAGGVLEKKQSGELGN